MQHSLQLTLVTFGYHRLSHKCLSSSKSLVPLMCFPRLSEERLRNLHSLRKNLQCCCTFLRTLRVLLAPRHLTQRTCSFLHRLCWALAEIYLAVEVHNRRLVQSYTHLATGMAPEVPFQSTKGSTYRTYLLRKSLPVEAVCTIADASYEVVLIIAFQHK